MLYTRLATALALAATSSAALDYSQYVNVLWVHNIRDLRPEWLTIQYGNQRWR